MWACQALLRQLEWQANEGPLNRIEDFGVDPAGGQDVLDISAFGSTADDFRGRVTITEISADALVTIDGDPNQTVLLAGIGDAAITQQDFAL